jgi:hypothetical protein
VGVLGMGIHALSKGKRAEPGHRRPEPSWTPVPECQGSAQSPIGLDLDLDSPGKQLLGNPRLGGHAV